MSLPCSAKDCFMCQLENRQIKESFKFDARDQIRKKNSKKNTKIIFLLNIVISIVFLLLLFNLFGRKK